MESLLTEVPFQWNNKDPDNPPNQTSLGELPQTVLSVLPPAGLIFSHEPLKFNI